MRSDIQTAYDGLRGHAFDAEEAKKLLEVVILGTLDKRGDDYELDANLVICGAALMSNSSEEHKMKIARKWLVKYGVPEDQLDELIVIAKLSRDV